MKILESIYQFTTNPDNLLLIERVAVLFIGVCLLAGMAYYESRRISK